MEIKYIRKRDGSTQDFDLRKIEEAITKALAETREGEPEAAEAVAATALERVVALCQQAPTAEPGSPHYGKCIDGYPSVEEIQDEVEAALMAHDFFHTAKAYILYRSERQKLRERDIFKKRVNLKPYEYPELYEYVEAIRHSYWIHTEFSFTSDVNDYKVNATTVEQSALKNAMLAIAQVEVAVKTFWGKIYDKMPKPEIDAVGATFAESEVRHMDAYSHLLELLGLNYEFTKIRDIPALHQRVSYLDRTTALARTEDNRQYLQSVLLFSLFIEHVSLFSQFLIIMSFNKHKNLFKGMSNAVEATSKEEQIHGLFGIEIINLVRTERPEWFDEEFRTQVEAACREAYESESVVVDWILEAGELDFLSKAEIKEFIKNRFNNSLVAIGYEKIFDTDEKLLENTEWFDNEVIATKHVDFFDKRSINYNKRQQSVTADDLF